MSFFAALLGASLLAAPSLPTPTDTRMSEEAESTVEEEVNTDQLILQRIAQAIELGAPLYNEGDPQACADAYEEAIGELQSMGLRPWHGHLAKGVLSAPPEDPSKKAWAFRRFFDGVIADLSFQPRREAELPEGFPEHGPIGEVIEKDYPPYRMAMSTGRSAFGKLFRHIQRRGIPMTAPVEMARDEQGQSMMGFMYEDTRQGQLGEQDNITVVDIGEKNVLSLALRGRRTESALSDAQTVIREVAAAKGITIGDDWRLFGYSSPMVPMEQRYFEIQVSIVPEEAESSEQAPE